MNISKNIAFKIPGLDKAAAAIKNIRPGGPLQAKILERLNTREAIIDLAGKRVRVEFLKGLPKSNSMFLSLEGREDNTFYFKIIGRKDSSGIQRSILDFSILSADDIKNINIGQINKSLNQGLVTGIFAYNMLLVKTLRKHGDPENGGTADIIKKLLSLGIKPENAAFLSMILSGGRGLSFEQLYSIFIIIGLAGKGGHGSAAGSDPESYIKMKIDDIIKDIDDIGEPAVKSGIINEIFDNLPAISDQGTGGFLYGEIAYPGENGLEQIKYINNDNSVVISLNLSYLGDLDILIKCDGPACNVSVFCQSERSIEALKSRSDELTADLKALLQKKVGIFFHNSKEAAEKIIEIYSFLSKTKNIDVRV